MGISDKKTRRNHSPICYLITGLVPPDRVLHSARYKSALQKAEEKLGCDIRPMYLLRDKRSLGAKTGHDDNSYYVLEFRDDGKQKQLASQIGESLYISFVCLNGPLLVEESMFRILEYPVDFVYEHRYLFFNKLQDYYCRIQSLDAQIVSKALSSILNTHIHIDDRKLIQIWDILPVIIEAPFINASGFLAASNKEFFVYPGELDEVLAYPEAVTSSVVYKTRMENALLNAFKTIEALIGDPSKDNKKYFARLKQMGSNPNENVGYRSVMPLHRKIREFNYIRDKKAGHGSTPNRQFTFYDLLDFQTCARYVLLTAIEHKLGHAIFE